MGQQVYKELYEVMKSRRGPYTGVEIPEFYDMVEELFAPQEAEVNNVMSRKPATAGDIAGEMNRDENEIKAILETMADKGLCRTFLKEDVRLYQGEPFMPGIFEYQFMSGKTTDRDKKIARLTQAYKKAFNAVKGDAKMTFPITRVITVDRTIEAGNTVHTYDQVSSYIDKNDMIGVGTCYCRHAAKLVDEDTHDMPMEVCMWFGNMAEYAVDRLGARKMTTAEAKKVLDMAEEAGLVHMSRNTTENVGFIYNYNR
jgi:predicted transcriptional regulator